MIRLLVVLAVLAAAPPAEARTELARRVRAALLRAIPFDRQHVRVARLRLPRMRWPKEPLSVRVELRATERFRGPTTFAVVVKGRDRTARAWATADLRVRVPTLAAARDLPRGRVLTADDVYVAYRELGDAAEPALSVASEAAGRALRRPLRAHEPVRAADLAPVVIVRRGTAVLLVARQGGLTITARGRALEDGARGDTVRALNLASNRTVFGRVDDTRRLIVEF